MIITQFNGYQSGSLLGASAVDLVVSTASTVGVKLLQEQLRKLAFDRNKFEIDPAQYDGKMTLGTIMALANAAHIIGAQIHPVVGAALNVVGLIKKPIGLIPYGDQVINIILSPWIIDSIYSVILDLIRVIPGGGSVADAIDVAMSTVKSSLAVAAAPLATLIAVVPKPSPSGGFGEPLSLSGYRAPVFYDPRVHGPLLSGLSGLDACPAPDVMAPGTCSADKAFIWVGSTASVSGHWERLRVGQACTGPISTATPIVRVHPPCGTPCAVNIPRVPPGTSFPAGGIVRDHREWAKGRAIIDTDWGGTQTYEGRAPKANLAPADFKEWDRHKNEGVSGHPELSVRRGTIAFKVFEGRYVRAAHMGAFWDERTETLKIKVIPKPRSGGGTKYPWDYVADAVVDAANALEEVAKDTWNWIEDNVSEIYHTIKEYGCAIINSDIVVAVAATGAGIVATPAASAAVVVGAAQGRMACAALDVAELVYAVIKLLARDFPKPQPLTTATPPVVSPKAALMTNLLATVGPKAMATTMATAANVVMNCPPPIPVSGQLLLPLTPPIVPLATLRLPSRYPPGTIAMFDSKLQRFRIAIPIGTSLSGLNAPNVTHFEVEQPATLPAVDPPIPAIPPTTFQKATGTLPLYKQPLFWVAVGTGVGVVGGGGYALYRRRHV
jgi:hypothetical protein